MATNNFKVFAGGAGANVITQSSYEALTTLIANGFTSGTAESAKLNKVWRQSSIMSAVVAQYICDLSGQDALDNGTSDTLLANFKTAVNASAAGVVGNATKIPCRAATTADITTLAGGAPNTLDGVTLAANDRILVKDQSTGSQNGLYYVATLGTGANGTWTRVTDADATGELIAGMLVAVTEGTANADSIWMLTTNGTITVGSTAITFARKDAGAASVSVVQIQPISASVAANALTISASSLTLDFRSTTLGNGTVTQVTGAPSNLVVPSGATLGTVNAVQSDLYVLALNNAGTIELAVVNAAGGVDLSETGLISTTAISAAATSASTVYSIVARTNVAYRVIGLVRSTQAVAGTWATAPSRIQGEGGQALAAMQSLGYGQTWQNVSRTNGTTYYNTTGKPIMLIFGQSSASAGSFTLTVNGVTLPTTFGWTSASAFGGGGIIIPAGASYSINCPVGTATCAELR